MPPENSLLPQFKWEHPRFCACNCDCTALVTAVVRCYDCGVRNEHYVYLGEEFREIHTGNFSEW